MKFHGNPCSGSRANGPFSQFCERSCISVLWRGKQGFSQALFFWRRRRESGLETYGCNRKYVCEIQYSLCVRPVCLQVSTYCKCVFASQFTSQFQPTCTPSPTFAESAEHHTVPERSAQTQQHRNRFSLFSLNFYEVSWSLCCSLCINANVRSVCWKMRVVFTYCTGYIHTYTYTYIHT